ncbi:MAG: SAM-dependent methyltransferase [Opitutaceae bacterium]|jgi:SAM-dependent methyltransferase
MMPSDQPSPRDRFLALLAENIAAGSFQKLTLGKPRKPAPDPTLQNLFVRPITLKSGPHLTFVWRHTTRDVTKNYLSAEAFSQIDSLLSHVFLDAHLFTATQTAQLETQSDGTARLRVKNVTTLASSATLINPEAPAPHDLPKQHPIPATAPWLRSLGITNEHGQPREGMADKFRQIQKFSELVSHLLSESAHAENGLTPNEPLRIVDMGSGKGYLTFAMAALLAPRAHVTGIEARPELVEFCNRTAAAHDLNEHLHFIPGAINETPLASCEVLIALHACDTATDDAIAQGIAAGARLLVVSPCCQKEIRAQLTAPAVLADALRHGIFQERQAEFVTDALRAQILEWAGYKTKVFEFISTEHTAKNLLIVAQRSAPCGQIGDARAQRIRAFASFYGVRQQRLAQQLNFAL